MAKLRTLIDRLAKRIKPVEILMVDDQGMIEEVHHTIGRTGNNGEPVIKTFRGVPPLSSEEFAEWLRAENLRRNPPIDADTLDDDHKGPPDVRIIRK